jgi:hypothetical protein
MKKFSVVLFCSLLIFACASGQKRSSSPPVENGKSDLGRVWSTFPADGKLVIIGAAGRQLRREDAIMLALEDAAKKAAFFHGIYGYTETFVQYGISYYDFDSGKSVGFIYDDEYLKYIDQFEFDEEKDVFEEDNSVFVRVRFNAGSVPPLNLKPTMAGKTPEWIRTPPKDLGDYTLGVGYAFRHSHFKDAVITSYEAAAASILNKLHSQAASVADSFETAGYSDTVTMELQVAEGFLTEFYVLETWVNPDDRSVWTLAIAKNGGK